MAVDEFGRREATDETWDEFAARLSYAASDAGAADDLADAVQRAEHELGGEPDRLVYLSVPPAAMAGDRRRRSATPAWPRARG